MERKHAQKFQIGDKVRVTPFEDIPNAGQMGTVVGYDDMAWPYCFKVSFKTTKRPDFYADYEIEIIKQKDNNV